VCAPVVEVVADGDCKTRSANKIIVRILRVIDLPVPELRLLLRTDQNWWKVLVPVMEGWLVRWSVQTV